MKPGTLVKLSGRSNRRYNGVRHNCREWFNVLPHHIGLYIKTIPREIPTDIVLIEKNLIEIATGVMKPL